MSITFKVYRKHWIKIAYFIDGDGLAKFRSSQNMKEFIKEKYNGVYDQTISYGRITFEKEEHLTWFLLSL